MATLAQTQVKDPIDMSEQSSSPSLDYHASLQELHRKVDRHNRRMDRKFDALAQKMDTMMQFNILFPSTLSQIFSSVGSSSGYASVQFPVPLVVLDYPPDSPDKEGDDT